MRPSRVLETILVLMVFPTSTVWAQQVIYGCVKNNSGAVRIVAAGETCLPSEHAIQWPVGGAGTTSVPPSVPQPLRVVDQNGVDVGLFASPGNAARLEGGVWIGLPVTAAGFTQLNPAYFRTFYQSTDCSGDAYLPVDMNNMLRTGSVMVTNGQAAFSYPGTPDVDRTTIQSMAQNGTCSAVTPPTYMSLFGKVTTLDVNAFTPPFKIVQ